MEPEPDNMDFGQDSADPYTNPEGYMDQSLRAQAVAYALQARGSHFVETDTIVRDAEAIFNFIKNGNPK